MENPQTRYCTECGRALLNGRESDMCGTCIREEWR